MNLSQFKRMLVVMLVAIVLLGAVGLTLSNVNVAVATAPTPGSVRGSFSTSTYLTTVYTNAGTHYTAATRPTYWYAGDMFATVDVSGTSGITITPQFSADNVNWADARDTIGVIITTDVTTYTQFALAGEYLRFKGVVAVNAATDQVTVTIKATVKNTGGQ